MARHWQQLNTQILSWNLLASESCGVVVSEVWLVLVNVFNSDVTSHPNVCSGRQTSALSLSLALVPPTFNPSVDKMRTRSLQKPHKS